MLVDLANPDLADTVGVADFPSVLLEYAVGSEFCVSSSEFTSAAVRRELVNPLVLAGIATVRTQRESASQRVILSFRYNWTQHFPARQFTPPDVRTDDEVRRLAAAQPRTQCLAVGSEE